MAGARGTVAACTSADPASPYRRGFISPRLVRWWTDGLSPRRSMITLALDASTYRGSVAVLEEDRVLVQATTEMRSRDAERLMPAVDWALREVGLVIDRIERIVCGGGPGSFTSLRISASIAKGLAEGRGIPLFAVSSLALLVAGNVSD